MESFILFPVLASVLTAFVCGTIGTFTVLRRSTYMAGAISHACLAGLGLCQFLSVTYALSWCHPLLGAVLTAVVAALFLALRQPGQGSNMSDAMLSALWSVGMAVGLVFMAFTPGYQNDLLAWLFGSILMVTQETLLVMTAFCLVIALAFCLFWRGFVSISFNAELTLLRGAPARFYAVVLALLTALAVVLLVHTAGIILVIALLTLPGLAARFLTRRLLPMMLLSGVCALLSLFAGLTLAYFFDCQPSAFSVLCAAALAVLAKGVQCLCKSLRLRRAEHL